MPKKKKRQAEMSKGSSPRPFAVDRKTFDENWGKIFSKGKEQNPAKSVLDGEKKNFDSEEKGSETDSCGGERLQ